jgi:hypothetical protein
MEYLDLSPAITEPIGYKYVGQSMTWLLSEVDMDSIDIIKQVWPMYAPIEDEL